MNIKKASSEELAFFQTYSNELQLRSFRIGTRLNLLEARSEDSAVIGGNRTIVQRRTTTRGISSNIELPRTISLAIIESAVVRSLPSSSLTCRKKNRSTSSFTIFRRTFIVLEIGRRIHLITDKLPVTNAGTGFRNIRILQLDVGCSTKSRIIAIF